MEMFIVIMSVIATAAVLIVAYWFINRKPEPKFNREAEKLDKETMEDRVEP